MNGYIKCGRSKTWNIIQPWKGRKFWHRLQHVNLEEVAAVESLSPVWLFVTPWTASTPGFPILHCLPELSQTHVHWVCDAIQPSHPLWSPSPPTFNLSQHQGLFQWVSSLPSSCPSIGASASPSVLPMNIPNWFPLGLTGLISWQSKGLSRVFPNTTVQKHQFFGAQLSLWSTSHIHTWPLVEP